MSKTTYTDLFEDEVAEVLRDTARSSGIILEGYNEWYPARMVNEDGIYSSGSDMFTQYINGTRCGYVSASYLISLLAHKRFTVIGSHS